MPSDGHDTSASKIVISQEKPTTDNLERVVAEAKAAEAAANDLPRVLNIFCKRLALLTKLAEPLAEVGVHHK